MREKCFLVSPCVRRKLPMAVAGQNKVIYITNKNEWYCEQSIKGTSQKIDKFRAEFEGKIKKSSLETQFDVKKEMMRVVPILIARQHGDLISSLQFMFKAFHENKDDGGFAKMLAREYILQTIMALINNENKNLISHLINDMKGTLKVEEIEDFLHEFLSYSEEEKHQRYAGMQNVLLELLKAQS